MRVAHSHRHAIATLAVLATGAPITAATASPPSGPVRACAEWEPAFGTLIRWPLGIPATLVVELARDDSLYVLVESPGQESSARSAFQAWGVDSSLVRFFHTATYSHWTRDWGPHSVFDGNGEWGIVDPVFNGYPWVPGCTVARAGSEPPPERARRLGWEEDDGVNAAVALAMGAPLHEIPVYVVGGNIMVDGHGTAFSTSQMLDENAGLVDEAGFRQAAADYLGIAAYHFLDKPEVHGIQHIDCYAKLLDEETILVKRTPTGHPEFDCVEALVHQFESLTNCYGRPYDLVRIDCGAYGGGGYDLAAYTNSLILNDKVLVPTFGIATDEPALQTYRDAMPGYEVVGFAHSTWYYYDALHCRTMGIYDRHMLRLTHRRLDPVQSPAPGYDIRATVDARSGAGLVDSELWVYWQFEGDLGWERVPLNATAAPDSFVATLPAGTDGMSIRYYLEAADHSGRVETLPPTAPAGAYAFQVSDVVAVDPTTLRPHLRIAPNPFASRVAIDVGARPSERVVVGVYDASGRSVRRLWGPLIGAPATLWWDGRDEARHRVAAGLYWIRVSGEDGVRGRRVVMLR